MAEQEHIGYVAMGDITEKPKIKTDPENYITVGKIPAPASKSVVAVDGTAVAEIAFLDLASPSIQLQHSQAAAVSDVITKHPSANEYSDAADQQDCLHRFHGDRLAVATSSATPPPAPNNYLSALSRACAKKSVHFRSAARFAFIAVAAVSTAEKLTRNFVSHLKNTEPTKMTMIAKTIALSTPAAMGCHPTLCTDCAYAGEAKIIKMFRLKYRNGRLRSLWRKYVADVTPSPSGTQCRTHAPPLVKSLYVNEPGLFLPAQAIGPKGERAERVKKYRKALEMLREVHE